MRKQITLYDDQYAFYKELKSKRLLVAFVEYMFEDVEPVWLNKIEKVVRNSLKIRMENQKKKSDAWSQSHWGWRKKIKSNASSELGSKNNTKTTEQTTKKQQDKDILSNDNILREREEIWDNKLSHKESFDELYDNFYWINKWADRTKCDKLIKNLLNNWVSVDELLSDELLYKAECQIKWERRYVKKFETWLREYNQQTTEQREQTIKQLLVMYYNKKKEDDKFEQSARNPRNMLCERFWEKNIAKMYFEVKPKKTINLVFN